MYNSKQILASVLFVVLTITVLFFGFSASGVFPEINIAELINIDFPQNPKPVVSVSNDTVISQLKASYSSSTENELLPEDMKALWIDINNDIGADASEGTDAVKYAIYADINYYRNFVPNTFFIKPDSEGEFDALKEPDGSRFDVLAYLLYYVRDIDCKPFLVIDSSIVFDDNERLTTARLDSYLRSYDFKGVLLSLPSLGGDEKLFFAAKEISAFMKQNFPHIPFGVEVASDFDAMLADQTVINIFESRLCDFGYVDCKTTTAAAVNTFQDVALWWNSFASYYGVPFYCEHRADLIFTDSTLWGLSTELNLQLKALFNCPDFDGSCFYGVNSLKNKKALARDLSIFVNDVTASAQDTFSVDSLTLDESRVTFSGHAIADSYNLYLNDNRIIVNENIFEETAHLTPGLNTFKFFSNGGKYTYRIFNNSSVIHFYSPSENTDASDKTSITVFAVCPENSDVYAVFCGNYYKMEKCTSDSVEIPRGYCPYSFDIALTDDYAYNNELSIVCFYNGECSEVKCCDIYSDEHSPTDSNKGLGAISPYSDNGLGRSLMVMLNCDNTEQISEKDEYDTYHPYKSSLLKGTIDYIDSINVSGEGYLRYELKSGINVYGTDCVLINGGYTMPKNNVTFISSDDSAQDKTVLTFGLDWLSPVTVTPQMLDYKVGYQSFSYNIESFNAEYIDLKFYYADAVNFANELTFAEDCVFTSYALFKDESDNIIIRLYLRAPGQFYGYDLLETEEGNVQVTFKKRINKSISGKVVMLDPGHGGISMTGTALADNSVWEAQITLNIAQKAKTYLEQMGAKVIMTRVADIGMDLYERAVMCEEADPDIFVSIHCDGTESSYESGTHSFYYTPYSQPLALSIHNSVVNTYLTNIYVEADENFAKTDRKIKYYPFYVTRVDNCPSVLVETGFLTNEVEGYVLANPVNQDYIARAIAEGINNYFITY